MCLLVGNATRNIKAFLSKVGAHNAICVPHQRKDINKLEGVQVGANKLLTPEEVIYLKGENVKG